MRIHNKLEIKTKDKSYVSYNNMLLPFAEAIVAGEGYSDYLAIGLGTEQSDPFHLAQFVTAVPLVDDAHNFNLESGQLFLRKKWVLDESDDTPYEIVEVGLTANIEKDNPRIANRFIVNGGEPIYRDAGEEMTFEITIYLDYDNTSNFKLTGGENRLVAFLLGEKRNGDFYVARGYNDTPNDVIVERHEPGADKLLVEPIVVIEDDPPRVRFEFSGELSSGSVTEFLLIIGSDVVARQNVQNVYGGSSAVTVEVTADDDGLLTLSIPDVHEVSAVKNLTTGEVLSSFSLKEYGTSFKGVLEEIFSGYGFDENVKIITSKQQDRIAFINGSTVRIFKMGDSGLVEELDATRVDATDGYLYLLFNEMLFIKCSHPDGTYSMRYYYFHPNNHYYTKCTYSVSTVSYDGVKATDFWYDMDGITMDNKYNNGAFMLALVTDNYVFGFKTRLNNVYTISAADTIFVNGYTARNVTCMEPTNYYSNVMVSYDLKGDRMLYRKNNVFITSRDAWAVSIVRDYLDKGYPRVAKNYVYAADDENSQIKLFSIDTLKAKSIVFDGAEKIYTDKVLDYVVVKYKSGVTKVYFVDSSLNLYDFQLSMPPLEADIKEFYMVGEYMVFRLVNNKYFRLQINKNKYIVSNIPRGNVGEVTVYADTTPGQDGKNVNFKASMSVAAVND